MKKYVISLWCGSGYILDVFGIEAEDEYEALDRLAVKLPEWDKKKRLHFNEWEVEGNEDWLIVIGDNYPLYVRSENFHMQEIEEFPAYATVLS